MAYASLADLRAYLNFGPTSTGDDTLLTACLTRAQAAIDAYCRRPFEASADTTRYLDAVADVAGATLRLGHDLCAITSITNGDGVAVTTGQYVKEPRNATPWYALTLKASSGVAWTYTTDPQNAIAIVGRWAWSTSAPADIVQACLRTAAWQYKQRDASFGQTARPDIGVIETPAELPVDVKRALQPYRRVVAGAI